MYVFARIATCRIMPSLECVCDSRTVNMMRIQIIIFALLSVMLLCNCQRSEPVASYAADVQPILQQHCLDCHVSGGAGHEASGLSMASYEDLMNGTRYGPVVLSGDDLSSVLVMLIEGRADPSINMPHGDRPALTQADIDTIKRWVAQGALDN